MSKPKPKSPAEALAAELWGNPYLRKIILAELLLVYPWQFPAESGQG